eukprot:TRINITY_DN12621_c0_g1_i3.p1 TRINITY_DN12621_c0_g1~~TRINITY_DN12621_c0_g1_i3.p1  ORF type:complete len:379 (+),score=81.07 TRINITY_DN12621_c0_g1_i3:81-1217(+)
MKAALALSLVALADAGNFLDGAGMVGKDAASCDKAGYCKSVGGSYAGYSYQMNSAGTTTLNINCGKTHTVTCNGQPKFTHCAAGAGAPSKPAAGNAVNKEHASGDKTVLEKDGSCSASGGFSKQQAKEMVDLMNKMRCAVGTPPLKWNDALACQAQKVQNQYQDCAHHDPYHLPIPTGENVAMASPTLSVPQAAYLWFSEYMTTTKQDSFATRAHFTGMVWKSSKDLGCGLGKTKNGMTCMRCQINNALPNWGVGKDIVANVPKFEGTQAQYKKCGLDIATAKKWMGQSIKWGFVHPIEPYKNNIGLVEENDSDLVEENDSVQRVSHSPLVAVVSVALLLTAVLLSATFMRLRTARAYQEVPMEDQEKWLTTDAEGCE